MLFVVFHRISCSNLFLVYLLFNWVVCVFVYKLLVYAHTVINIFVIHIRTIFVDIGIIAIVVIVVDLASNIILFIVSVYFRFDIVVVVTATHDHASDGGAGSESGG